MENVESATPSSYILKNFHAIAVTQHSDVESGHNTQDRTLALLFLLHFVSIKFIKPESA